MRLASGFVNPRLAGAALLVLALAACATRPQSEAAPPSMAATEPAVPTVAETAPAQPRAPVDDELFYELLVAELAGRRGELDLALDYYLSAARRSDDPRIAERATRIAVYARNGNRAMEAAERWVALAPDNIEAHQVLATLHIRDGDVEKAGAALETVVTLSGDDPDVGLELVTSLLGREQNHRVALEVITGLLQRYPDRAVAHYARGMLAERVDDKVLALEAASRAVALRPGYTDALVLRARLLVDAGRADEAFAELEAAIDETDDVPLRLAYARLLVQADRFDRAAAELRTLFESNRENPNLVYALGLLAIESRRLDDAREYMLQVVSLEARTNDANYYLGRIAENQRDYGLAISHYLQVNDGENELDAQIRVAEMLARLDRVEEARTHLRKLQIVNPEPNNAVRFFLAEGEILRQASRHQEAFEVLSEALSEHPGNSELLYARALTAEKVGRQDIVEGDLGELIGNEPENGHALNALGYFLVDRTDRLEEARGYITRALELLPSDPAVIDSMGWLQYRMGNYEQALVYLRKAYEKLEDPEIAAHLGEVLWVTGDREGASKVWSRALELAPEDLVLRKVMQRFNQ